MRKEFFFIIITLVFSIILLLFGKNGYLDFISLQKTYQDIHAQNQRLVTENQKLKKQIKRIQTDPIYLKTIIRHTMGLTEKGEIVFIVEK